MSRLTDETWLNPERELAKGAGIDYWVRCLSPPEKSVGQYYRGRLTFEDLMDIYRTHLAKPELREELVHWSMRALKENVTLTCYEFTPEKCHRRILVQECKLLVPALEILIE